jgi:xylulokinase
MRDIVVGVDASTTAVKAIAFDPSGKPLHEAKAAYPLSTPLPGHVEQQAEDWWIALRTALSELTANVPANRIAGIALTHQRETFVLIDHEGRPVRPAILWLDERARAEVAQLSGRFGHDRIRAWTGKPPDPTPGLYAMMWLNHHEPRSLEQAEYVADVGTYLHVRLTGERIASLASADPLGIVDLQARDWRPELVDAAGLSASRLPKLVPPGVKVGEISAEAARACGMEAGTPVYAAVGDGQANSLGLGVTGKGSACLSLGSGVVFGMYSANYVHSNAYRTLTAPDGTGFMLETVLRSGMQLLEWVVRTTGAASAPELETRARDIQPGSQGLLMLPYFSGVMNPWWDENARGAMTGLSLDHTPAHLYRSAVEAICLEQAIATDAMEKSLGAKAASVVASGGGTNSELIMQCLTAIMERPIAVSPVKEAAALGAAMLAAIGAGWFQTTEEAATAMCATPHRVVEPDLRLAEAYRPIKAVYCELYSALKPVHVALANLPTPGA